MRGGRFAAATVTAFIVGGLVGCGSPPATTSPSRVVPPSASPAVAASAGTSPPAAGTTPSAGTSPPAGHTPSAGTAASPQASTWRPGPNAPVAILEIATATFDGRIWMVGGLLADGRSTDRAFVFDPASGRWSEGPALPMPLHHAALVTDGQRLWLLGGYVGDTFDDPTDAVWALDPAIGGATWREASPLPERRAAGAAAWDGTRIVYAGGVGPGVVSDLVFAGGSEGFEPIGRLSENREHLAAASDGAGRTWVMGGRDGGLAGNLARVDLVDGDGVRGIGDLPTPRGGVAAFHRPSVGACLAGGESPDHAHVEVECMTADGTTSRLPDLGQPRHGHGAAVVDDTVYMVVGGPEPLLTVSDTIEFLVVP